MTHIESLTALQERFPLPVEAELLPPFAETVTIHGVAIHTVGLATRFRGECITGSAGSLLSPPTVRAYMELLERLVVASVAPPAPLESPAPADWIPSRSSGVAIGVTFEDAVRRARLELVERDRVLRSWYGGAAPRPAELGDRVPRGLLRAYVFEAYLFEALHGAHTAGVFAFPRDGAPMVHGFAAREHESGAIEAALDECLQRLGFLWGEAVPSEPPPPLPTPSFHQEHYLYPANHGVLRRWLRGGHAGQSSLLRAETSIAPPVVEQLRPAWLSTDLWVARALPQGHVPLGFGLGHPLLASPLPTWASVHPVV